MDIRTLFSILLKSRTKGIQGVPGIDKSTLLDCDAGRRQGCKSFCCRLLVRLKDHERREIDPTTNRLKGYVDKNEKGICVHQDEHTGLCQNWHDRPSVCREYDCNYDKLLQVVMRSEGKNLACWMKESVQVCIDKDEYVLVPYIDS